LRRAARLDANHEEITNAIRGRGWKVQSLASLGKGVPDLLVSGLGDTMLVEVKHGKNELTPDQVKWHAEWLGRIEIVRTLERVGELFPLIEMP
jgi:hypothetical protein